MAWAWGASERKFLIAVASLFAVGLAWASAGVATEERRDLPSLVVDANSARVEVLQALPGLGPALAGRIVEARELSPVRSLDDLDRRVKGIGPAKVAAIRSFLSFDSPAAAQP